MVLLLMVDVSTITMPIAYDPVKRARALAERSLDFEDASFVFESPTLRRKTPARTMAKDESFAMACSGIAWSSLVTHRVARIAMCSA